MYTKDNPLFHERLMASLKKPNTRAGLMYTHLRDMGVVIEDGFEEKLQKGEEASIQRGMIERISDPEVLAKLKEILIGKGVVKDGAIY